MSMELISFSVQDHFGLILNEPAGKIAQVLVRHSVNIIVQVGSACFFSGMTSLAINLTGLG